MSFKEDERNEENISERCIDIAKDLLSIGNVHEAESVLVTAMSINHEDKAQTLLNQIRTEKMKINSNDAPETYYVEKDDVEDAEEALLHHNDKTDSLRDQNATEVLKVNPTESIPDPTDKHFDEERQKLLEIEAKNQLDKAQYAEMNTNRLTMRAKVLSLEVSIILKKYENDFQKTANTTVIVSGEIENLLETIQNAINMSDLGEAEENLMEAERIYNDAYAKIPKNIKSESDKTSPVVKELVIPKHTPGAREKAELKGNEGDEVRSIRIAQAAINAKDYERAEKFLLKAERLRPTIVAQKLLIVVRDLASKKDLSETPNDNSISQNEPSVSASHDPAKDSNTAREDNQKMALKITKIAETSIKEGNYERAKRMLDQAEMLSPTVEAKELLQRIIYNKEVASDNLNLKRKEVVHLFSLAKRAEDNSEFDLSEKYLLEAKEICPDNKVVIESLLRIRNARAKVPRTEEPIKSITSEVPETLEHPMKTYISEARTAMAQGYYEVAETIIFSLKGYIPNADVDELLREVTCTRASRSSTENIITDAKEQAYLKNIQSSDYCLQLAQKAINAHDNIKTKNYLTLALRFNASESVKSLLDEVQKAITSEENKTLQKEAINETKRVEAEEHIQNARQAFIEANLDKSEQLLHKAKELHPQEKIDVFLGDVLAAKTAVSSQLHSEKSSNDQPSADNETSIASHAETVNTATVTTSEEDKESNNRLVHKTCNTESTDNNPANTSVSHQSSKYERTSSPYSKTYRVDVVPVSKPEAQTYIPVTQQAFIEQNDDEAEQLKLKAEELNLNSELTMPMEQIHAHRGEINANYDKETNTQDPPSNYFETVDDIKRVDAENSIKVAQTALSSGDLDRAERFLNKAERIFPTEQAKRLLEDISLMKTKKNAKDDNNQPFNASNKPIEDEVKNLINVAFAYIDKKEHHRAEIIVELANKLSPGAYTKDVLEHVKSAIKNEGMYSTTVKQGKKTKKGNDRKSEAEYYIDVADAALSAGKIIKAETNYIIASSLHQSRRVDEGLKQIRQSQISKAVSNTHKVPTGKNINSALVRNPINNFNDFKSDEYIRMGINARNSKYVLLAEHFLIKAQTLSPSTYAKSFLKGVVEAKKKVIESQKSWWHFW